MRGQEDMKFVCPPLINRGGPAECLIRNLEDTGMSPYESACPFSASQRANQCESCCQKAGLPPCVAAYLRGPEQLIARNVVPWFRDETRKAA